MHCVSRGGCYLVNSYCDLQEENERKKESYQACWLNLVLETRPQYKLVLSEKDNIRKESYKQEQVVHFMVERSPSQILRLGSYSRAMTEHCLPFNLSRDPHVKNSWERLLQQEKSPVILRKENNGAYVDKEKVTGITQTFTKPVRVNFRPSRLMSSPRETSHRMQRRE
ncbi:uncharacterized protein zmp:0000000930 [Scomber scombrus]|uniref:Uncharacterized protein zmp:0000000930 n=1 Tax=Scomber scombrus TaxID=13677 RepID=A0AAV1N5M1_SCOSC|nr:telethonin [Scomber scombrus]